MRTRDPATRSRLVHDRYSLPAPTDPESGRSTHRRMGWVFGLSLVISLIVALGVGGRADRLPLTLIALVAISAAMPRSGRSIRSAIQAACGRIARFTQRPGEEPLPWSEGLALVACPFLAFNMAHGKLLGAIDTRPVVPTALSLVRQGNLSVDEFAHGRDRRHRIIEGRDGGLLLCFQLIDGHIYSSFPQGMVPFAIAPAAVAVGLGLDAADLDVQFRLERLSAGLVASGVLTLFFLLACTIASGRVAGYLTLLLASGSAILTTVGLGLWQHGGVAFWLLAALLVEFRGGNRLSFPRVVVQAFAMAQMLACRPTAGLLVGLFGLWVLCRAPWRALVLAAMSAACLAPWVVLNVYVYHHPFGPGAIRSNTSGQFWHFFRWDTMLGVFICPARGLLVYQPWVLLAGLSLVPAVRLAAARAAGPGREGPAGWRWFCAVGVLAHAFLISAWYDWSGGFCWGSRLLTETVPLAALLCAPAVGYLGQFRAGRWGLAALVGLSILFHAPCIAYDADRWNSVTDHDQDLWSWRNAPFLFRSH